MKRHPLGRVDYLYTALVVFVAMIGTVSVAWAAEQQVAANPTATASASGFASFPREISLSEGGEMDIPITGLKRFVVGAPNLITVESSASGLHLIGRRAGATAIAVWTDEGRKSCQVTVVRQAGMPQIVRDEPPPRPIQMSLRPGGSEVIKGQGIIRAAVSDPEVANIVPASTTEVIVNAKKDGTATVRVWDARGLQTYVVTVARPEPSMDEVAVSVAQRIGIPGVEVRASGETLILTGKVNSLDLIPKIVSIAESSGKKIVSMLTLEPISTETLVASLKAALPDEPLTYDVLPDQTLLIKGSVPSAADARKVQDVVRAWAETPEPSSEKSQSTQINFSGQVETPPDTTAKARTQAHETAAGDVSVSDEFSFTRCVFSGRIPNGPRIVASLNVNPTLAKQVLVSAQVLEIDRGRLKQLGVEWASLLANVAQPLFSVIEDRVPPIPLDDTGPLRRTNLAAQVKALIDENAARVLSEPKVLIADGHSANILVGGEFPIPVAQSNTGGVLSITVQFKTFGISLAVRPQTAPDNRILLTVTPEVSSLDFQNAVRTTGITIPAIKTRRTTTTVHVANGEALAIGGLLSSSDAKDVLRVPLLSKIPIIGELFKSSRFERNQTELVILVTPQIVENGAKVPIQQPQP